MSYRLPSVAMRGRSSVDDRGNDYVGRLHPCGSKCLSVQAVDVHSSYQSTATWQKAGTNSCTITETPLMLTKPCDVF